MLKAMLDHNIKKVQTPLLTIGLRKRPQRVIESKAFPGYVDLDLLDPKYVRIKKETDRQAIKDTLKQGGEVPGFELSPLEFSVTIK